MSWIKKWSALALVLASILVALICFEIAFALSNAATPQYNWDKRYMLFGDKNGGTVFQNLENAFFYQPNKEIESTTFYFIENKWVREYDYNFFTNNLGLVQNTESVVRKKSLLLLGDSFTEGQGAYPWFDSLQKSFAPSKLQFVNGGVMGSGFQSWRILHDKLISLEINIEKLVIIFISDDYSRSVWMMPDKSLNCISNYKICKGDEYFFGKPPEEEMLDFLEKLRQFREGRLRFKDRFREFFKNNFPGTTLVFSWLKKIRKEGKEKNAQLLEIEKNNLVISEFIRQYKNNVIFVHIPQKEEVIDRKFNRLGRDAQSAVRKFGGTIYDGLSSCELIKQDFFQNDGHPNAAGYKKISDCVSLAIKQHWGY